MRVTGKHLAAACKLVFKIARNDKNDHFFRNSNLLGENTIFYQITMDIYHPTTCINYLLFYCLSSNEILNLV